MSDSIPIEKLAEAIAVTALDLYGRWEGTKATGFAGSALIEVQMATELEPIIKEHIQSGTEPDAAYCKDLVVRMIALLRDTYGAESRLDLVDFSPEALIAVVQLLDDDDGD